jgi:ribosomal protein S6
VRPKEYKSDNHFTQEEVAYILELPRYKVEQIERLALRKLAYIIKRKYKNFLKLYEAYALFKTKLNIRNACFPAMFFVVTLD